MITEVKTATVCVVGAGYVGLPLSNSLARSYRVVSYDIDPEKVRNLSEQNENPNHVFTTDPAHIAEADFISICVPVPLSRQKRPDMTAIKEAATQVGWHMKKGSTIIVESSVYPGATEELFVPILERASGYDCGKDFQIAYSPERINPGDSEHDIERITKIVAAADQQTLERVADLYRHVTPHIYKAKNIRTAEATKLVENTQRDLNIAFVNELAMMLDKMDIRTQDVLEAAATKWNFQNFSPGLVGGYCIPVVPYFLVQKAEEAGYHPEIILAGRAVNDRMPKHVAEMAIKAISGTGKVIKGAKVLLMGCAYKDNVSDTRATPAIKVIKELNEYGAEVFGYDPLVRDGEKELGINFFTSLSDAPKMDGIIVMVAHDIFTKLTLSKLQNVIAPGTVIIDVRGALDIPEMSTYGIIYKRL
jgi:UDPglucose 6-dehydrogenase/UDP-N-acetyl-D-galactosamine dehydrogenase